MYRHAYLVLLCVTGCAQVLGFDDVVRRDGGSTDAESVDASPPGFSISSRSLSAAVPLNGSNFIEIDVIRTGGFDGAVTIALQAPPSGLTATDVEVAGTSDVGELVFDGAAPLSLGNTFDMTIVASSAGFPDHEIMVPAVVTGPPGALDTTYFTSGFVQEPLGGKDGADFTDALVTETGLIYACGYGAGGLGGLHPFMAIYQSDGSIDGAFNGGDHVEVIPDSASDSSPAWAIGHQLDGSPLMFGEYDGDSNPRNAYIVRLTPTTGVPDMFFGNGTDNGETKIDLGDDETIADGLVLANDKLVAVGSRAGDTLVLQVVEAGNSLDTTGFGASQGYINPSLLQGTESARAVVADASGRLLVLADGSGASSKDLALLRVSSDGTNDAGFGNAGVVVVGDATLDELAADVILLPNDKILVLGTTTTSDADTDVQLRQFNDDGTPDTTFGTDGIATLDIDGTSETGLTVVRQPDGRLVVAARSNSENVLMRFRRDGAPDTTFGTAGRVSINMGTNGELSGATLLDENHLLIFGGADNGVNTHFGVLASFWY